MFSRSMILGLVAAVGVSSTLAGVAQAADYRVQARIRTGTAFEAKGVYREQVRASALRQRFTIEINGAAPNAQIEVRLNGSPVTLVTTDALGHAELQFSSVVIDDNPGDNKPPLPTDFPHINAGDTLGVGTLTATFQ